MAQWKGLQRLVKITATRQTKEQTSVERRYYINSYPQADAARFNDLVRGHWGIENHLHWHLDVTFSEDASRAHSGNAPLNLNILRKMALQRIRQVPDKRSLQKRRFRATLNQDYLLQILGSLF